MARLLGERGLGPGHRQPYTSLMPVIHSEEGKWDPHEASQRLEFCKNYRLKEVRFPVDPWNRWDVKFAAAGPALPHPTSKKENTYSVLAQPRATEQDRGEMLRMPSRPVGASRAEDKTRAHLSLIMGFDSQ